MENDNEKEKKRKTEIKKKPWKNKKQNSMALMGHHTTVYWSRLLS